MLGRDAANGAADAPWLQMDATSTTHKSAVTVAGMGDSKGEGGHGIEATSTCLPLTNTADFWPFVVPKNMPLASAAGGGCRAGAICKSGASHHGGECFFQNREELPSK